MKTCKILFFIFLMVIQKSSGVADLTITSEKTYKHFVIIIASYNNENWCRKNIESALNQHYPYFRIIYVNDASIDKTVLIVKELKAEFKLDDNKLHLINNLERIGACANFYHAIHLCKPEEIVVILDGDDWFAHDDVLNYLNNVYSEKDIWLTYGQWKGHPNGHRGACSQIPEEVIKNNSFREYPYVSSHLRTFYAGLFQKVNREDFLYVENRFFPMTCDVAMMIPMLEMAGAHSKFIPDILYIYNDSNPINDGRVNLHMQRECEKTIRNKNKYLPLVSLFG